MADLPTILIVNGPNLNLLGVRDPELYGGQTLAMVEQACAATAKTLGLAIDFRQSNHEGEIVGWLHEGRATAAGVVINAAAYSHTSVAIHDALEMIDAPIIEVHLTNIYRREQFRHHSTISGVVDGVICGLGGQGYQLALSALAQQIKRA